MEQTEGGAEGVSDVSAVKKYQKPLRPMSKEEWEKDPWNYHRGRQEQGLGLNSKSGGGQNDRRSLLTKMTMQKVRDILLNENKLKEVMEPVVDKVEAVSSKKHVPLISVKDLMIPIARSGALFIDKPRPKPPPGWPRDKEPTFADFRGMTVEQLEELRRFYSLGLDYTRELKKYLEEDKELNAQRIAEYDKRKEAIISAGIKIGVFKPEQFQCHFFTLIDGSGSLPITIEEEEVMAVVDSVVKEEPILPKCNNDVQPPKPNIIEKDETVVAVVKAVEKVTSLEEPMPKDNDIPPPTVQPAMIKEEEENPSMKKLMANFLQRSPIIRPISGKRAPIPPVGYSGKRPMFANEDLGTKTVEELKKYFDALNQEIAYEKDLRSFIEEDNEACAKLIAEYDERRAKMLDGVVLEPHYITYK